MTESLMLMIMMMMFVLSILQLKKLGGTHESLLSSSLLFFFAMRQEGIEPTARGVLRTQPWKGYMLPLHHWRSQSLTEERYG